MSSATGRLTQDRIAKLVPKAGGRYIAWDATVPGFGVRVTERGAKSFVFTYRLPSKRFRWATLGRVGAISLDTARELAQGYLGALADGKDPLREWDQARTAPTVSTVADRFLKEHVPRLKLATQRAYRSAVADHIRPLLGPLAIRDLTRQDVIRLHHGMRSTPVLANRVLAALSKFMSWAEDHGFRAPRTNPCHRIRKNREQPKKRYLTADELRRLGTALRIAERWERMSLTAVTSIRLLLLTGARVSEILSLRWREVDLAHSALRLADSKTGKKTILLSAPAVAILKAWPQHAGSPYVFPGEGRSWRKGKHRVNLADAWAWLRRRARLPDVRLHDLRHSFASVAVSSGQTLPTIGALLGHTQAATTQRYAHLMDDPLRAASEATGARIAAAVAPRRTR